MLIPDFVHTLIYGRAGKRLHAEASALAVFLAGAMAQNVHLDDYQCGIDKAAIGDLLDGLSVDEALATMAQARRLAAYDRIGTTAIMPGQCWVADRRCSAGGATF